MLAEMARHGMYIFGEENPPFTLSPNQYRRIDYSERQVRGVANTFRIDRESAHHIVP